MKRFYIMASIVLCAGVLSAGTLDKVVLKLSNITSNSAVVTDTSSKITGYINRIDMSFANATNPLNIAVAASNELTGLTTTLPVDAVLSTNVSYQLTNYVQRLSLYNEAITLTATNALNTTQSTVLTIFYERP